MRNEPRGHWGWRLLPIIVVAAGVQTLANELLSQTADTTPQSSQVGAESTTRDDALVGITLPYRTAVIAPVVSGKIAEIVVLEGSRVKAGDLLFRLADEVQRAKTDIAGARANSALGVDLARARWDQALGNLERLRRLQNEQQAAGKELKDALTDSEISRIEYELAHFDHTLAGLLFEQEQSYLNQFVGLAPFDGYVAKRIKEEGETVDEQGGILTIVQLDPLLVSLDCPLEFITRIKVGDVVEVHPINTPGTARQGTVELAHRVADGASQTFKVRVVVGNPDHDWMSGWKVRISWPSRSRLKSDVQDANP